MALFKDFEAAHPIIYGAFAGMFAMFVVLFLAPVFGWFLSRWWGLFL
jgi:hypothetical protein